MGVGRGLDGVARGVVRQRRLEAEDFLRDDPKRVLQRPRGGSFGRALGLHTQPTNRLYQCWRGGGRPGAAATLRTKCKYRGARPAGWPTVRAEAPTTLVGRGCCVKQRRQPPRRTRDSKTNHRDRTVGRASDRPAEAPPPHRASSEGRSRLLQTRPRSQQG